MKRKNSKQRHFKADYAGSWTVTLAVLILLLNLLSGCAASKIVLHPLEQDFFSVKKGDIVTARKDGYFMSNYYLGDVMGVQAE